MTVSRSGFVGLLLVVVAVRLVLSIKLPVTGDEAYFYQWGVRPDWGFWDHPPMIGWWIAAMLQVSHAPWSIRLPSTLLIVVVALAVVRLARSAGEDRALLAGTSVVLTPPELLNVLISTDTPLVFFSMLSVLAYARALRGNVTHWYALSGAMLGLAALSKYFAALLGFAYLIFVLMSPRYERRWRGLVIVYLCMIPFVLATLYWNWQHCWANVMFNFFVRHDDAGLRLDRPLLYLIALVYATSIVGIAQLLRMPKGSSSISRLAGEPHTRLLLVCGAVPLAIFGLLSSFKTIGLHWLLAFVPMVFATLAFVLSREQLRRGVKFLAVFTGLHLAFLLAAWVLPIETWAKLKIYDGLIMTVRTPEVVDQLKQYERDFVLTAEGYSPAVTLAYSLGRYVPVYGRGSSHARHDDILSDMRQLAAKNIAVFRRTPPPPDEYEPYFDAVEYRTFVLYGATFHVVLGRDFKFAPYRDQVLTAVRDNFYRIPWFLPQGGCYFCARYFGTSQCPVRGS